MTDLTEISTADLITVGVEETKVPCFKRFSLFFKCYWKTFVVFIIPPLCAAAFMIPSRKKKDVRCLFIASVMALYWFTVAIPLPMTAMIPVVLLPVFGVSKVQDTCMAYLKETNIIFIGVYLLAFAVDLSQVYVRFTIRWMELMGCSHYGVTFAAFTATAFASMWISSHVATALTLPILVSLLKSLEDEGLCQYSQPEDPNNDTSAVVPTTTTSCYLLGVAYSANIGGTATLIGSCVNLATRGFISDSFTGNNPPYIQFDRWMSICAGPAIFELVVMWLWLNFYFMGMYRKKEPEAEIIDEEMEGKEKHMTLQEAIHNNLQKQYSELGPIKWSEIVVIVLIVGIVTLWVLRDPVFYPGWERGLQHFFTPIRERNERNLRIRDGSAVIVLIFLLNVLPGNLDFIRFFTFDDVYRPTPPGSSLINWKMACKKFPWDTFFVIGGGFSIFKGIKESGLLLRLHYSVFKHLNHIALLVSVCSAAAIFTQFTDSVALFFILAPVVSEVCKLSHVKGYHILVALGVCCSFTFILPSTTSPNALVYKRVKIPIKQMVIAGIVPLVVCVGATVIVFTFLGQVFLKG